MIKIITVILILAIILLGIMLVRAKNIFERLLLLNIFNSISITFLIAYAVIEEYYEILDLIIVYMVMGYIGINLFAFFVIRGGRER